MAILTAFLLCPVTELKQQQIKPSMLWQQEQKHRILYHKEMLPGQSGGPCEETKQCSYREPWAVALQAILIVSLD